MTTNVSLVGESDDGCDMRPTTFPMMFEMDSLPLDVAEQFRVGDEIPNVWGERLSAPTSPSKTPGMNGGCPRHRHGGVNRARVSCSSRGASSSIQDVFGELPTSSRGYR